MFNACGLDHGSPCGISLKRYVPVIKASSMSPSSICRARRAMAVGQSALGYMVPYPMVSWVSRANENAAVNPVTYLTHSVWPGGGLSWSTARSPLARASRYHNMAKRSQWRRKEPQKASTTQRQRRDNHDPHMSRIAPSQVARPPAAGPRIRLRPSLLTSRWWLVGLAISGDEVDFRSEVLLFPVVVVAMVMRWGWRCKDGAGQGWSCWWTWNQQLDKGSDRGSENVRCDQNEQQEQKQISLLRLFKLCKSFPQECERLWILRFGEGHLH